MTIVEYVFMSPITITIPITNTIPIPIFHFDFYNERQQQEHNSSWQCAANRDKTRPHEGTESDDTIADIIGVGFEANLAR